MEPQLPNSEPASTNFAGLLSALTAAKAEFAQSAGESWTKDLADDVATLTYERALQTHARYRTGDPPPLAKAPTNPAAPGINPPAAKSDKPKSAAAAPNPTKARKTASVTIRMCAAEFDQLQQRAAEAGLSISAYLRSCTLEVESLRAEVKQALSDLRSSAPHPKPVQRESPGWRRLFRRP